MLVPISLPFRKGDDWFGVSRISGQLFIQERRPLRLPWESKLLKRIAAALECCESPYKCIPTQAPQYEGLEVDGTALKAIDQVSRTLFQLGNKRFLRSIAYASKNTGAFQTSVTAFEALTQKVPPHTDLNFKHCFQRALAVAKVSRSFWSSDSAVLIGAFLQTGAMHAWIMEGDSQPDPYDRVWINYRPLLAIVPRNPL